MKNKSFRRPKVSGHAFFWPYECHFRQRIAGAKGQSGFFENDTRSQAKDEEDKEKNSHFREKHTIVKIIKMEDPLKFDPETCV